MPVFRKRSIYFKKPHRGWRTLRAINAPIAGASDRIDQGTMVHPSNPSYYPGCSLNQKATHHDQIGHNLPVLNGALEAFVLTSFRAACSRDRCSPFEVPTIYLKIDLGGAQFCRA